MDDFDFIDEMLLILSLMLLLFVVVAFPQLIDVVDVAGEGAKRGGEAVVQQVPTTVHSRQFPQKGEKALGRQGGSHQICVFDRGYVPHSICQNVV